MQRVLVLVLVCCATATAAAQNNPNQAEADKYFAEGRELLVNQKDAKGACEKFQQAIALDPTAPGVMLNLGLCYEMQEKWASALHWFRKAQSAAAEAKPEPLVEYRNAAEEHQGQLAQKVAIAKIDVSQAPAGVRITVDGRAVTQDQYLRLEVDADSTIEARAPGKAVFREAVTVDGTTAKDIVIVMQDAPTPRMRDPGKGRRRLAYIMGAAGIVLYGATLAYGLSVASDYKDSGMTQDKFEDAETKLRYLGTGMFVAGTAAVGAAIVLYFTARKPYREEVEPTASVTPIVSPDTIGFGYSRAF